MAYSTIVYYDGFCPICQRTSRAIKRLDLGGRVAVISFRHESSYKSYGIELESLENEMYVVRRKRNGPRVYSGFEAVRAVIRALPLLWLLLPFAWLMVVTGLGDTAYRWLAANRLIVPDARHCAGESCAIGPAERGEPK